MKPSASLEVPQLGAKIAKYRLPRRREQTQKRLLPTANPGSLSRSPTHGGSSESMDHQSRPMPATAVKVAATAPKRSTLPHTTTRRRKSVLRDHRSNSHAPCESVLITTKRRDDRTGSIRQNVAACLSKSRAGECAPVHVPVLPGSALH